MNARTARKTAWILALALFAGAWFSAATAAAPDQATPASSSQKGDAAKLQIDGGVIMLSQDQKPFETAENQQAVYEGERMMVTEESGATIIYNDGCEQTYDEPGVYEIPGGCTRALPLAASSAKVAWLPIAGAVALGGAVGYQLCDRCDCPPVSR